jgi:hypothetical protein
MDTPQRKKEDTEVTEDTGIRGFDDMPADAQLIRGSIIDVIVQP